MQELSFFRRSPDRLLTSNSELRSKTGSRYIRMNRNIASGAKAAALSQSMEQIPLSPEKDPIIGEKSMIRGSVPADKIYETIDASK